MDEISLFLLKYLYNINNALIRNSKKRVHSLTRNVFIRMSYAFKAQLSHGNENKITKMLCVFHPSLWRKTLEPNKRDTENLKGFEMWLFGII